MRNPGITRHMRDLERLKTIQAVIDGELRPGLAAERLGLSVRHIERLVIRYRARSEISCSAMAAKKRAAGQPSLSERSANFGQISLITGRRRSLSMRLGRVASIVLFMQLLPPSCRVEFRRRRVRRVAPRECSRKIDDRPHRLYAGVHDDVESVIILAGIGSLSRGLRR